MAITMECPSVLLKLTDYRGLSDIEHDVVSHSRRWPLQDLLLADPLIVLSRALERDGSGGFAVDMQHDVIRLVEHRMPLDSNVSIGWNRCES